MVSVRRLRAAKARVQGILARRKAIERELETEALAPGKRAALWAELVKLNDEGRELLRGVGIAV